MKNFRAELTVGEVSLLDIGKPLLKRDRIIQRSLEELDKEILAKKKAILDQINARADFLIRNKLENFRVTFTGVESEVTVPLRKLTNQMIGHVNYIHFRANNFSCVATESTIRQAKEDALQAYQILQNIIDNQNYNIPDLKPAVLTIHDNITRNMVIGIVAAVFLVALGFALAIGGPLAIVGLGLLSAGAAESTLVTVLALSFAFGAAFSIMGGLSLGTYSGFNASVKTQHNKFCQTFSEKTPSFFHHEVNRLLPPPAAVTAEPTVVPQEEQRTDGPHQ